MPFELNENYMLPPLNSKAQVLSVIHELTQAGIRGAIAPRTLTAVLYSLQVALSVHNSNLPDRPLPQLTAGGHQPTTIEGAKQNENRNTAKKGGKK